MEQAGRDIVLNPLGKRPNSCVPHLGGPARVCDGTKNSQPSSWERGKGVWLLQRRQRVAGVCHGYDRLAVRRDAVCNRGGVQHVP